MFCRYWRTQQQAGEEAMVVPTMLNEITDNQNLESKLKRKWIKKKLNFSFNDSF